MNLVRRDGSHGLVYRPRSLDDQVERMVEDMFEDLLSSTLMPYSPASRTDQDVITPRVTLRESGRQGQQSRMERYYRRYAVNFMLPAEVDDTSAQARLENGVLRLSLPKKQAAQAKRLTFH